jgi:glycosyltransferase involved in cell wall biosynthesis
VLDSGSTDKTVAVAQSLGARVLVHIQQGAFNIAEQRNWVLENGKITTEWVLFLDADEEVGFKLRAKIETSLLNPGDFNCFELTPRYLFWGKWLKRTQGYPNWHPRIVKHGAVLFAGGVWEHFDKNAVAGRIDEPYDHYANSKGLSDWLSRHDRYSTWEARRVVDFLTRRDKSCLGTNRKLRLRILAARFYPIRPFVRFLYMYIIRRGFMEGVPSFVFCLLYCFYEWMTVIKIVELRRLETNKPL